MKIPILIAVACSVVLSMDGLAKLDEDSKFNVLDFVDKNSRRSYAAASISARNIVKKHSEPIDEYMGLFDYPIQAANGCITGNKLRGLDPVECITMVTNPVTNDTLRFHESYRQAFTNAQLEVLIFNAIEIRNIPVLNELLRIRVLRESFKWSFLQDAFCWALISQSLHMFDDFQGFEWTMPSSVTDFGGNESCNSLNDFARLEYDVILSTSVTLDMVALFHSNLLESNEQLNLAFFIMIRNYGTFKWFLISRPYPTTHFSLYKLQYRGYKQLKCLKRLLQIGALVQKGSICSAVNRFDKNSALLYFNSGLQVDWDFEMNCIAKSENVVRGSTEISILIDLAILEMERQYFPERVPNLLYHGLKGSNWSLDAMECTSCVIS